MPTLDGFRRRALRLAEVMYRSPAVMGVALTGSVARGEAVCHDIDLVVFHGGQCVDGSTALPDSWWVDYDGRRSFRCFSDFLQGNISTHQLMEAAGLVPLHIAFMHEKVLSDCAYLAELNGTDPSKDYHKRVLCELPLLLLRPGLAHGEVMKHLKRYRISPNWLRRLFSGWPPSVPIRHTCKLGCFPERPWKEVESVRAASK